MVAAAVEQTLLLSPLEDKLLAGVQVAVVGNSEAM